MKRKTSPQKTSRHKASIARPSHAETSEPQTRPQENKQMSPESTLPKGSVARPAAAAPTSPAASAAAGEAGRQPATIRYVDRADIAETFADSITGLMFDGQTLRIELGVTRFDDVKANSPITGRRYPACRLVLPPAAAVDLINRMQQIAAALTQAGVVKQAQRAAVETPKSG
jgi:hypothetical protein